MKIDILPSDGKGTTTITGEGVISPTQDDCKQEDVDFLNQLLGNNPNKKQFMDLFLSMDSETLETMSKDIFPSMDDKKVSQAISEFVSKLNPDETSKKNVYQQIIGELAKKWDPSSDKVVTSDKVVNQVPSSNKVVTSEKIVNQVPSSNKVVTSEKIVNQVPSSNKVVTSEKIVNQVPSSDKVMGQVTQSENKNKDQLFNSFSQNENNSKTDNIVVEKEETKVAFTDTAPTLEEPLVQPLVNVTPINTENTTVSATQTPLAPHAVELAQQIKDQIIDRILVSSSDLNDNREVVLRLNPSLLAETQVSFQKVGQSLQVQFLSPNTESLRFLSVNQLDLQGYLQDELKNFRGVSVRVQQQGSTEMGQPHDGRSRNPYEYQNLDDDDNDPSFIA